MICGRSFQFDEIQTVPQHPHHILRSQIKFAHCSLIVRSHIRRAINSAFESTKQHLNMRQRILGYSLERRLLGPPMQNSRALAVPEFSNFVEQRNLRLWLGNIVRPIFFVLHCASARNPNRAWSGESWEFGCAFP